MQPLNLGFLALIGAIAIILLLCMAATMSRLSSPEQDRRTRTSTRNKVEAIRTAYLSGAITLPQATMRLREIEAPADIADRLLVPDWIAA